MYMTYEIQINTEFLMCLWELSPDLKPVKYFFLPQPKTIIDSKTPAPPPKYKCQLLQEASASLWVYTLYEYVCLLLTFDIETLKSRIGC